jgi:hypothetical protein
MGEDEDAPTILARKEWVLRHEIPLGDGWRLAVVTNRHLDLASDGVFLLRPGAVDGRPLDFILN